jgi:hypothetical protein
LAPRPSRVQLFALGVAMLGLSACGAGLSAKELAATPGWFKARQKEIAGQGYPDLASIPDPAVATQDDARWRAVGDDLLEQADSLEASPRAQPAPAGDAATFESEARRAVENARPK